MTSRSHESTWSENASPSFFCAKRVHAHSDLFARTSYQPQMPHILNNISNIGDTPEPKHEAAEREEDEPWCLVLPMAAAATEADAGGTCRDPRAVYAGGNTPDVDVGSGVVVPVPCAAAPHIAHLRRERILYTCRRIVSGMRLCLGEAETQMRWLLEEVLSARTMRIGITICPACRQ